METGIAIFHNNGDPLSGDSINFRAPEKNLTFEEFLCGSENLSVIQKAILMAENGISSFQAPGLYIYGGPGTGKTHLLSAIANAANSLTTLVVGVGDLLDQLDDAWKRGDVVDLRDYLIDPDILLLDDLHMLKDDQRFKEDVFSMIRLRLDANLAVAVTSIAPPIIFRNTLSPSNVFSGQWDISQLIPAGKELRLSLIKQFLGDFEVPERLLETIVGNEKKSSKRLKEWAVGLRAGKNLTNLLRALGFELISITRNDGKTGGPMISGQWRLEMDGKRTEVDVSHLLGAGKVLYRCWCPYPGA